MVNEDEVKEDEGVRAGRRVSQDAKLGGRNRDGSSHIK